MGNPNYIAGVSFERKRKKFWESWEWTVIRASGSHGIYDLCCFPKYSDALPMGIQCKRVKTDKQAERMLAAFVAKPPLPKHEKFLQVLEVYSQESRKVWNIFV